jgi:hypothetical protein
MRVPKHGAFAESWTKSLLNVLTARHLLEVAIRLAMHRRRASLAVRITIGIPFLQNEDVCRRRFARIDRANCSVRQSRLDAEIA